MVGLEDLRELTGTGKDIFQIRKKRNPAMIVLLKDKKTSSVFHKIPDFFFSFLHGFIQGFRSDHQNIKLLQPLKGRDDLKWDCKPFQETPCSMRLQFAEDGGNIIQSNFFRSSGNRTPIPAAELDFPLVFKYLFPIGQDAEDKATLCRERRSGHFHVQDLFSPLNEGSNWQEFPAKGFSVQVQFDLKFEPVEGSLPVVEDMKAQGKFFIRKPVWGDVIRDCNQRSIDFLEERKGDSLLKGHFLERPGLSQLEVGSAEDFISIVFRPEFPIGFHDPFRVESTSELTGEPVSFCPPVAQPVKGLIDQRFRTGLPRPLIEHVKKFFPVGR